MPILPATTPHNSHHDKEESQAVLAMGERCSVLSLILEGAPKPHAFEMIWALFLCTWHWLVLTTMDVQHAPRRMVPPSVTEDTWDHHDDDVADVQMFVEDVRDLIMIYPSLLAMPDSHSQLYPAQLWASHIKLQNGECSSSILMLCLDL